MLMLNAVTNVYKTEHVLVLFWGFFRTVTVNHVDSVAQSFGVFQMKGSSSVKTAIM